jgi:putative ABC transport system permease protein
VLGFWQDLRYAGRILRKQATFALAAAFTLGLGIGANTMVFSFVNALLLKPLPFKELDKLVSLREDSRQGSFTLLAVTPADYLAWRSRSSAFEQLAAYQYRDCSLASTSSDAGDPQRVLAARVSSNFFSTLQVQANRGRSFLPEEEQPEREDVTILSHGLWLRQFNADVGILGTKIYVDQHPYTVVGIMPEEFDFPLGGVELWTPLTLGAAEQNERRVHSLLVIGRFRPEVSMTAAMANVQSVAKRLESEYPQTNAGRGVKVVPLREQQGDYIKPFLVLMQIATLFVLGIACTNVANMQLARSTARAKEVTIRTALGASRRRVLRLLLVESVLIGLIGGIIGVALAFLGVSTLKQSLPLDVVKFVMGWKQIQVDWIVLLFTLVIAVGSGILFGLSAALQSSHVHLAEALREGARGGHSRTQSRLRSLLVIGETSLALVMLVAALQMAKGFQVLLDSYRGFSPDRVMTLRLLLPERKYSTPHQVASFYDDLVRNVAAAPGVESAAVVSNLPGGLRMNLSAEFRIEGMPEPSGADVPWADVQIASPAYLSTLRVRLQRGRLFAFQDGPESPAVAIISERMARQYWPNQNPIGQRLRLLAGPAGSEWRQVIGVVDDVRQYWFERTSRPTMYVPMPQFPRRAACLVVRNSIDPNTLAASLRAEVRRLDPNLPVYDLKAMDQVIGESLAGVRISADLMRLFGVVALILSALGVYGVMAYSVAQRQREFALRSALGATRASILGLIFRHCLVMSTLGIAVGLPASIGLTYGLSSLVFGLPPLSLILTVACSGVIVVVALIACCVPARAALQLDPIAALRCE